MPTLFWNLVCQPLKSKIYPDFNYYHHAMYIAPSTRKGSGIFVNQPVTTGSVLMIEKSLVSFQLEKILDNTAYAQISTQMIRLRQRSTEMNEFVDSLTVSNFLVPSSSHKSQIFDVQRFQSNGFNTDATACLFEYQSKFNHGFDETTAHVIYECFTNPDRLPEFAISVIVANQDIQANEELLLGYVSSTASWDAIRNNLRKRDVPQNTDTMPPDKTLHDYVSGRIDYLNRISWNEKFNSFAAQITDFLEDDAVHRYFDMRNTKIQISHLVSSANIPLLAFKLISEKTTEISNWQNALYQIARVKTDRDKKWLNEGTLWCKIVHLVYTRKLKSPIITLKTLLPNGTSTTNDSNDAAIRSTLIDNDFQGLYQAQKTFAMKAVQDQRDAEKLQKDGANLLVQGKYLLSIDKFSQSINKSPHFPQSYVNRANAKFYIGTLSSIRSAFEDCTYAIMLLENLQFEDKTMFNHCEPFDNDCNREDFNTLLNYQIANYNFEFAIEYDEVLLKQARDTLRLLRATEKTFDT